MTAAPGPAALALHGGLRERRRLVLGTPGLNGIDYVEVDARDEASQKRVRVHLLKPDHPDLVAWLLANPKAFRLTRPGREITPRVLAVTRGPVPPGGPVPPLELHLDRAGGFAVHTLRLEAAGIYPAFSAVRLDFKADCPARFDCGEGPAPPVPEAPAPRIDYETRDFAGFRTLMLDRMRTLMPAWEGGSEADLTVTVVEQLAWAADRLAYMQESVHTESFLGTCRLRTSMRRHGRLVDHRLGEGTSAQAVLDIQVEAAATVPAGTQVYARILPDPTRIRHGTVVRRHEMDDAAGRAGVVYETMAKATLRPQGNRIPLHAWGLTSCALPAGATQADLAGRHAGLLRPGSLLLLEEALDPATGLEADADPAHRFLVRLTRVELLRDPLGDRSDPDHPRASDVTRVHWDRADALPCRLALAGTTRLGDPFSDGVVARANLVLADHGRSVRAPQGAEGGKAGLERVAGPVAPPHPSQRRAHRVRLSEGPLAYRHEHDPTAPAAAMFRHDPARARPQLRVLLPAPGAEGVPTPATAQEVWEPGDLLSADGQAAVVAVEPEGEATWVRFGDGRIGRAPPDGRELHVAYRVGSGPAGRVGHGALAHVAEADPAEWAGGDERMPLAAAVLSVRNPLPSWGGLAADSLEAARRDAPEAFRARPQRAVTEADYAAAARLHPEVQHAVARFRWTGSWHTVFLYVDPKGQPELDPALARRVHAWVERFAQAGYDLEVRGPEPVPLELEVHACADRHHLAADVEQAVRAALGSGLLPDGTPGFFHPDRHTFGQPVHVSAIVAAVERVEGVESVRVAALRRAHGGTGPKEGRLEVGPLEVVRLDDDPDRADHGRLTVRVDGGSA